MIGAGLVLASLAGLELALLEHLAGFRSHTLILAGLAGIATLGLCWAVFDSFLSPIVRVLIAGTVFGIGCWYFSRLFARFSGGSRFKL